jgi:hypothetical protein
MKRRRLTAEKEFSQTVRAINRQAKKIGVEPDYDEDWKNLSTKGYETQGENLLETQDTTGITRK